EVLRMRPPAQGNQPRILQKEVEIAGHTLPKGAYLFNSFYNMQHDPQVFPDPGTFDPTRFLDGALASTPNFVPFGHGPRNCVAQSMAIQQLMAIVTGILRDHVLVPEERDLPEMRQTPFLVPAPFKVRVKSKH
ncbi:MAG: cytochrome P450, partial [Pseudomonadota bacterium]